MQFLLRGFAMGVWLEEDELLQLTSRDSDWCAVTLFPADEEDLVRDDVQFCQVEAKGTLVPPANVQKAFEALDRGELPEGSQEPQHWVWREPIVDFETGWTQYGYTRGRDARPGSMPALQYLPKEFQKFVVSIEKQLKTLLLDMINLVRWRLGITGSHDPFRQQHFLWSLLGAEWKFVPIEWGPYTIRMPRDLPLSDGLRAEIGNLASSGLREPFAHSLLREASQQRDFNPRSAVLLGIAAAEVGLKQCISELVPDSAYLVEKLQAPPLPDLMKNYLPRLPVRLKISDQAIPPPQWIREEIDKGIQIRNKLAHRPMGGRQISEEIEKATIDNLLMAVEDLLWMLDYYCGNDWPLKFLSRRTKSALGIEVD